MELADEQDRLTSYGRRFVELASSMGPLDEKAAAEETLRLYRTSEKRIPGGLRCDCHAHGSDYANCSGL